MLIKKLHLNIAAVFILSGLALSSCKKDDNNTTEPTENTSYAYEQTLAEQMFNDMDVIFERARSQGQSGLKGGASALASCAKISIDSTDTTGTVIIDFGLADCLGFDGRFRRGKLIIEYSGMYQDSGYTHKITPLSYYVDDNLIDGVRTVSNMGKDVEGNIYYNITCNGTVDLAQNGGRIQWSANRTRTLYAGASTPLLNDNLYRIEGSSTLIGSTGTKYTINITDPLLAAFDCSWIKEGIIEIFPEGKVKRYLDYGNGVCDNKATLTINGFEKEVTLR